MKVLVTEHLSDTGIEILRSADGIEVDVRTDLTPDDLKRIIGDYHALIVRSKTKVTADLLANAANLKVVGRAGVGIDNVDVDAATRRGIIVMNSPEGNTVSTAELTMAMMLGLSRRVPEACASLKRGEWDRKRFVGSELMHKTLGIVGLGRIGGEVARRAAAFGMKLIGDDPFCTEERAEKLGVKMVSLDELLRTADIITFHVPLTDETRGMIGPKEFSLMKKGVKLVNCSRGGVIDEQALHDAVKAGIVSGCALDVYDNEPPAASPLVALDQIITTPHIGASTSEAQSNVATEIARQVIDVLQGRPARNAVNLPLMEGDGLRPYIELAEKLGTLLVQLMGKITGKLTITFHGEINSRNLMPVTRSFLCGLLKPVLAPPVNLVNAPALAAERGIEITEIKIPTCEDYASLITVEGKVGSRAYTLGGTLFADGQPRIVRIDGLDVDVAPQGPVLIVRNDDKPGAISHIATVLAKRGINIARMTVGRDEPGGKAITVLNIDEPVKDDVIDEIKGLKIIKDVRLVVM
ncbi:MAG TPA: phosphoglycerate dehydrogenase [Planctomycetota bacterium]|nr:phosphoglycerate dehydrogenase [Planctomycetota bacterium]